MAKLRRGLKKLFLRRATDAYPKHAFIGIETYERVGSRVRAAARSIKVRLITRVPMVDISLTAVAVAFGALSLAYPFGRDQGLFYYVGREWLHGSIPYRDTMDQKPPLIYLIYALATVLFGENLWSIRLLELIWVVAVSYVLGSLAAPKNESPVSGTRGVAAIASAVLYWGFLSYWDTAQCEIWCSGFFFLSLWAGRHIARRPLAWRLAGVFAGLALLTKPTVTVTLVVVVAFFVFQIWDEEAKGRMRWREIIRFIVHYSLAAVLPIAIAIGYFWAVGGLSECLDILIGANRHYILNERTPGSFWQHLVLLSLQCWPFSSWVALLLFLGGVYAWKTRSFEVCVRYALATLLLYGALASVAMQYKYFGYHWGIGVFAGAYVIACSVNDFARWLSVKWPKYGKPIVPTVAYACIILSLYFGLAWTATFYSRAVVTTYQYMTGATDEASFDRTFDFFGIPTYWWGENRRVGRWIAEHSTPDDLVVVRGFEPAIYAVSGRRAPTRFFWTTWLTHPDRVYKRVQWTREDREAIRRHPPRYFVVFREAIEGPLSAEFAAQFGFVHERFGTTHYRVMGRL